MAWISHVYTYAVLYRSSSLFGKSVRGAFDSASAVIKCFPGTFNTKGEKRF